MDQQRNQDAGRDWRLVLDVLLALLVGVTSLAAAKFGAVDWSEQGPPMRGRDGPPWSGAGADLPWTVFGVLLLIMVGVALRRRLPRVGYATVLIGTTGYLALGHPIAPVLLAPALGLLALSGVTTPGTWPRLMPLVLPMLVVGLLAADPAAFAEVGTWRACVGGLMFLGLVALMGILRRNRADAHRRDRAEELGRTAYEERLRIAREVHDVVGHNLSVISLQAGAALHVLDKRPDQVAEALRAIRRSSRGALTELRTTLDVFHGNDPNAPRAPEPGLSQLGTLVAPLAELGRPVTITVDGIEGGATPHLPSAVDHAAYRITQEALTNILRHVPGAGARVELETVAEELIITVQDDGPHRPGLAAIVPGHGIAGMRERARAVGGALEVDTSSGRVVVRAPLPIGTESIDTSRPGREGTGA
ncbi:MAG: sensor histidine kinase [Propionibacteriaceae bacterium]